MATNITRYLDRHFVLPVVVTHPASPQSGDPVRYGVFTGLALTDEGEGGNAATETSVNFGAFVAKVSVKGINDQGNSAVAKGDAIFYDDDDTPPLSKKATGNALWGFAIGTVGSGQTATIEVLHVPSPGLDITVEDQNTRSIAVTVPSAEAADATAVLAPLLVASENIEVTAINFIPSATKAGADTNTATLAVRNVGSAGAGTDDLVTFSQANGNDLAANVPASFGSVLANEEVDAGDVLVWHRTKTGNGIDSPGGVVVIEYMVVGGP